MLIDLMLELIDYSIFVNSIKDSPSSVIITPSAKFKFILFSDGIANPSASTVPVKEPSALDL